MKIRLMVVPPGGGEIDYVNFADVPAIPREGDYIIIVHTVPIRLTQTPTTCRVRS